MALIEEVSFKPLLWKTRDTNYKRRDKREEAWADIATTLNARYRKNLSRDEVVGVFKNLKDSYYRQRRSNTKATGSGIKAKEAVEIC
ncbi:hypothetical protein L596_030489 [Steinernema carpocapsae]|uniref:MADF domain-containing protein n=1 Tax=Steinernema carpocapsae TaxID=34508 RepID=A0A4U5LPJ9_STECR|nr:hypothetical protein L596_030489 [Steinernema carpocapsae]